jgi:hypothetical protein
LVEAEESAFETSHHRIMRPNARSRVSYVGVLREAPFLVRVPTPYQPFWILRGSRIMF